MKCFCSNCGNEDIVFDNGIWICMDCGYEGELVDEEEVVFKDEEFYIEEEY